MRHGSIPPLSYFHKHLVHGFRANEAEAWADHARLRDDITDDVVLRELAAVKTTDNAITRTRGFEGTDGHSRAGQGTVVRVLCSFTDEGLNGKPLTRTD